MRWFYVMVGMALSGTASAQVAATPADAPAAERVGTFSTYPLSDPPTDSVSGDFDGDGRTDVATTTFSSLVLHLSTGRGGLRAVAGPPITGLLTAGDFNGDGRLDLVSTEFVSDTLCGIILHAGRGDGTFESGPFVPGVRAHTPEGLYIVRCSDVATGDFDADGKLDVALTYSYLSDALTDRRGNLNVFFGDGTGNFATPYVPPGDDFWTHTLLTTDLDGDRATDIVIGETEVLTNTPRSSRILAYRSDGRRGFAERIALDTSAAAGTAVIQSLAAGDFDADRKIDLAFVVELPGRSRGAVRPVLSLLGRGDGTFSAPTVVGTARGAHDLIADDFDGDRKHDLAVISDHDTDGDLSFFKGNGDGTFAAPTVLQVPGIHVVLVAGHFDADRRLDLVTTERYTPSIALLRNTGCEPPFALTDFHRWPWPWRCYFGAP